MKFTIENGEYKVTIDHTGCGPFNLVEVLDLVDQALKGIGYADEKDYTVGVEDDEV